MDNNTFYQYLIQEIVMLTRLWTCLHISLCVQNLMYTFKYFYLCLHLLKYFEIMKSYLFVF